ncbi:Os03g0100050 [Oryza sativa Japonica Group]|uniref:Os03g0100050 protein n=1 Tax=Oryza sativa subsp. japonica TaxID=39947 RepID=C7J0J3_ORYSJ|nr:Os03g0100050 [Oryza sativa Japonica Group]|eukprot:NP_001173224.1 Os03g0100050 [Oryza sativa Japonica Group]
MPMPSRARRRSKSRWPLGEPPPGLFPARDDLLRLLAVVSIAAAAAAACSLLNRRPKPLCDSGGAAYTHHDGNLECVQGFNKYGNLCIEDGLVSQTATKIFQELDILNMADELLSKGFVGLSQDGAKVAKIKVLDSARAFFEKTFSSDGVEEFKCPDLVAELYRPLTCQIRQWISRNIMSVTAFGVLVCEVLEDNAIDAKIGNSECEPWVVTSWLRDHLLVPQERRNAFLWKKVITLQYIPLNT